MLTMYLFIIHPFLQQGRATGPSGDELGQWWNLASPPMKAAAVPLDGPKTITGLPTGTCGCRMPR